MKRLKVKAVHDHDLRGLLESLGILEEVQSGRATCLICGQAVTLENLHCLLPRGDLVAVVCSKTPCIEASVPEGGHE